MIAAVLMLYFIRNRENSQFKTIGIEYLPQPLLQLRVVDEVNIHTPNHGQHHDAAGVVAGVGAGANRHHGDAAAVGIRVCDRKLLLAAAPVQQEQSSINAHQHKIAAQTVNTTALERIIPSFVDAVIVVVDFACAGLIILVVVVVVVVAIDDGVLIIEGKLHKRRAMRSRLKAWGGGIMRD